MLKTVNLADFALGIDMLSDEASLPKGAVRSAVNVDFNNSGDFRSRYGFTQIGALGGAHSLWGSLDGTFGLFGQNDQLRRMVVQEGVPVSAGILYGLTPSTHISYDEYADQVFFTNGHELGTVSRNKARFVGVSDPPACVADAFPAGTLPAGEYGVAYSYVMTDGEESGLSPMTSVVLEEQGGVDVGISPIQAMTSGANILRVYMTPVNGDVLYQVAEFGGWMSSLVITEPSYGKQADNQFLRRMTGGQLVRMFNGRLAVAKGNEIAFSQPFRYGLTSPRHDFIQFNAEVIMMESVVSGLYVGVAGGPVYFLAGSGPSNFIQTTVSTNSAVRYGSCRVQAERLPSKLAERASNPAALWLGKSGYSLGMPDGSVEDIQADRILLPALGGANVVVLTNDGIKQAMAFIRAETTPTQGVAVDT